MRRHSVKTRLAEALRRASHRSAFELLVNIFVEFFAENLFSAKFAIFLHHLGQICRNFFGKFGIGNRRHFATKIIDFFPGFRNLTKILRS